MTECEPHHDIEPFWCGVLVDVLAILFGATAHTGVVLGQLLAKAAMLYPAIQCHDALPQRLPAHLAPSQLQASLAGVVHQVLRDELGRVWGAMTTEGHPGDGGLLERHVMADVVSNVTEGNVTNPLLLE